MSPESIDYYAVLDVAPEATQEAIYSAYQEARTTYALNNPDLLNVFSREEAMAWVDLVEEAYLVIGAPNSRRQYDLELKDQIQPQLPSFEFQSEAEHKVQTQNQLPTGFAKTKISRYQVIPSMEEAIEKQELFDGLFLKKVREYKGIDLKDFSKVTCIAIRHLYAIENNNFSVLPAAVFVRGYIIQYCRHLNLEEQKVVPSFMALFHNDN